MGPIAEALKAKREKESGYLVREDLLEYMKKYMLTPASIFGKPKGYTTQMRGTITKVIEWKDDPVHGPTLHQTTYKTE